MHYTMMDLPGTISKYYIFTAYDRSDAKAEVILGEAVIIGLLGLYEDQHYYSLLKGLGIPMCIEGLHTPMHGLNRDPGMRYHSGSKTTPASQPPPQEFQKRKKLNKLITTGFPAAFGKRSSNTFSFKLFNHYV